MWIRWIQIRIRNTAFNSYISLFFRETPFLDDKVELSACRWILLPQHIVVVGPGGHENQVTYAK